MSIAQLYLYIEGFVSRGFLFGLRSCG